MKVTQCSKCILLGVLPTFSSQVQYSALALAISRPAAATTTRAALLLLAGALWLNVAAALSPVSFSSVPTGGNIYVVRSAGSTTAGAVVSVDEYVSTTASQSAAVQSVAITGCYLPTGANQAYGSNSADAQFALFTCNTAATPTTARLVARLNATQTVDLSTGWTTNAAANAARGVSSADGKLIVVSDPVAVHAVTFGTTTTIAQEFYSSTLYAGQVATLPNGLAWVGSICYASTAASCASGSSSLEFASPSPLPAGEDESMNHWEDSTHELHSTVPHPPDTTTPYSLLLSSR